MQGVQIYNSFQDWLTTAAQYLMWKSANGLSAERSCERPSQRPGAQGDVLGESVSDNWRVPWKAEACVLGPEYDASEGKSSFKETETTF